MKKLLIIGLSLLLYANIHAQEPGHYLYLNTGGGLHNLSYDLQNGNEKGSFSYTLNAGYGYFFNRHWGIQTGLGLQSFKPTATLNYKTATPSTDTDGAAFEYRTSYNSWKEQQRLLFLDIPIGLEYRHMLGEKLQLLASAGVKLSIPVKTTYKTTGGEIVTTGFYSQWNVELKEMPQHGFNNITDQLTGDVSIKPSCSGFADLGALYGISSRVDLYAGGYVSYGMNNVLKTGNKIVYQQDGVYNGVLASDQTDKARTVSLGLKVGVLWHFGHKNKVAEVKPEFAQPVAEKVPEPTEAPKIVIAEQLVEKAIITPENLKKEADYTNARAIAESTIISFKFNSPNPLNSEDSKIKELSAILKANPDMKLRIVGHAESDDSQKTNYKSGLQRAGYVRQKFLNHGVLSSQLKRESKSFDSSLPPTTSKQKRMESRVVTLIIE